MTARKGGGKPPPDPADAPKFGVRLLSWQDVEPWAPPAERIIAAFRGDPDKRQHLGRVPNDEHIHAIREFCAIRAMPASKTIREEGRQANRHARDALRDACTAVMTAERTYWALTAGERQPFRIVRIPRLLDRMVEDANLMRLALEGTVVRKSWQTEAGSALGRVIDPALQSIRRSTKATSVGSVRVRVLSVVLRECGFGETEASETAIEGWLKARKKRPPDFLRL